MTLTIDEAAISSGTASAPADGRVPLSILDLAVVGEGSTGADAIRASLDLAVEADRLGYRRVWYAEHHLAPGVASASPAVLAALAAARTTNIRVGSGAVLLSTTSPLVAAEQFGAIAAAHPGRVDLGLGRAFTPPPTSSGAPARRVEPTPARVVDGLHVPASPPFDYNDSELRERFLAHARVLATGRQSADFRSELEVVLALRAGELQAEGRPFVSPPVQHADLDLWVLASSGGESARVAGELGLPLAANFHVSPSSIVETVASYRAAFRPGVLAQPYVTVSVDVLAADTDAEAERLADGFADWVLSIRRGPGASTYPRPGTSSALSDADRALVRDRLETRVVGGPATVVDRLAVLQRATGADELLVTTQTHDPADSRCSFALLADAWSLTPAPAARTR
ncbi:LLM class flavin-dependent oxidoreductase [Cellulomonas sp. JH27-2]|uniref:LLM class flavin-dependent oxidoreductase n=1 Tax=Cellulomonas sp. JH27-2 TaxID=2774139 RepID=UPI0017875AF6|nr:LLM class flavin-dependent oxidoreductase [Cellulomonas sp. JH27-2]MBD8059220.1 LLM class flavin-dependent oxidoreductase [Cellulomonas sp. JH27-2]